MADATAQAELDQYLSSGQDHTRLPHPEDRHDSDNLSIHSGDKDSLDDEKLTLNDDHDEDDMTTTTTTTATRSYHIPTQRFDANTGPKGVIADAQSYSRARQQSGFRKAFANITNTFSSSKPSAAAAAVQVRHRNDRSGSGSGSDGAEQVLAEDDDDEFMRSWRASRLEELQTTTTTTLSVNGNGAYPPARRRMSPSKRTWGYLEDVDATGYLDAVEKVADDVVVAVCLYDPEVRNATPTSPHPPNHSPYPPRPSRKISIRQKLTPPLFPPTQNPQSNLVESSLASLALRHPTTRFVKMHHEIAEMTYLRAPAVLAYRGGEVFATLSGVRAEGLEEGLRREGVL